jgi:Rieske Fe-S protein
MDRRGFLDTLLWTSLAGAALSALAPLPWYLVPPKGVMRGRRVRLGKASALADGGAFKGHTGVKPVIVVRDGLLRAFDATCTHAGCTVDWDAAARIFTCHCHGAQFDREGKPTKGPAKEPLARVDFLEEGGEIVVP